MQSSEWGSFDLQRTLVSGTNGYSEQWRDQRQPGQCNAPLDRLFEIVLQAEVIMCRCDVAQGQVDLETHCLPLSLITASPGF